MAKERETCENTRPGLAFIFVTLLIDVLGFGLVIPVIPKLVIQLSGGRPNSGAHMYGILLSVYGLMQFIFAPIFGSLSDRFGRRPILLLSLLFNGFDYVVLATAPVIGWLFVGRLLSGITGASFTTASAYIADISPPEKRAQNFGIVGAAFGIGFILGPALGGLLGNLSPRAPFWAAAALSLVNALYGTFVLPESLAVENRRPFSVKSLNPLTGLAMLTRFQWVKLMAFSIAAFAIAQQALQSTWVLYTTYRYGWTPLYNGLSLALIGICSGVVQVVLTKIFVQRFGERKAILFGMLFEFIGFVGIALSSQTWMIFIVLPIWCLSGVAGPSTQSLVSQQYGPDEQGAVQGAQTSLQSLMGIVGPLIATWVFGYFISPAAPVKIPGSSFLLGAVLVLVAMALAYRALKLQGNGRPGGAAKVASA